MSCYLVSSDHQVNRSTSAQATPMCCRYDQPLEPFREPTTGGDFLPEHTFDTKALGYQYDRLQQREAQRMEAVPDMAVIPKIDPKLVRASRGCGFPKNTASK